MSRTSGQTHLKQVSVSMPFGRGWLGDGCSRVTLSLRCWDQSRAHAPLVQRQRPCGRQNACTILTHRKQCGGQRIGTCLRKSRLALSCTQYSSPASLCEMPRGTEQHPLSCGHQEGVERSSDLAWPARCRWPPSFGPAPSSHTSSPAPW